jgi:hypothetical protein
MPLELAGLHAHNRATNPQLYPHSCTRTPRRLPQSNVDDKVRLDEVIAKHFRQTGCFMRLCGRSAKDAEPLDRGRIRREYQCVVAARAVVGASSAGPCADHSLTSTTNSCQTSPTQQLPTDTISKDFAPGFRVR